MKRKVLLSMLLATSISLCAQINVFRQGFEEDQVITDPTAPAYPDYVNFYEDEEGNPLANRYEIVDDLSYSGEKALYVQNDNTLGGWQSALKFRNLPIKANTSYRVTYYAMTTEGASFRTRMLCGVEKSDVPFVGSDNVAYDDIYTGFNAEKWQKHVSMFYYTSDEIQQAYYLSQDGKEEPTLPEGKYFLNLNMYSEGEYYVDEISLDESSIAGITYAVDALRVDFGYKTDFSNANVIGGRIILDPACAVVTIGGEEVEVEAVELKLDGYMYIYLDDVIEEGSDVMVSFVNPKGENGPKYSASETRRPNSWDENDDLYVLNFSSEKAEYDRDGDYGFSNLYDTPVLLTAVPEKGSFDLSKDINTFMFTFSKDVNLGEVRAKLGSEELNLETTGDFASTLVFSRTSIDELATMTYTLTISNILPERYLEGLVDPGEEKIKYGIGAIDWGGEDPITEIFFEDFSSLGNGSVPAGWKSTNGIGDSGDDQGVNVGPITGVGNSRVMQFSGSSRSWDYAMYVRQGAGSAAYCSYGGITDEEAAGNSEITEIPRLYLEKGNYILSYDCGMWSTPDRGDVTFDVEVYALSSGTEVGSDRDIIVSEPRFSDKSDISFTATKKTMEFDVDVAGNYVLKFIDKSAHGFAGLLISNVKLINVVDILGAKEKADLKLAMDAAKEAMALICDEESGEVLEIYEDNVTTAALRTAITQYTDFASTSPSAYNNAIEELNNATTALLAHKKNVDDFYNNMEGAATAVADYSETKYNVLDSYKSLSAVWAQYEGQTITDDAVLIEINEVLGENIVIFNNMVTYGVPALTARLDKAVATALLVGVDENASQIIAAENAVTDDDRLANELNTKIKWALYDGIADGTISFDSYVNEETQEEVRDSIDMSSFLKNGDLYIQTTTNVFDLETLPAVCPGWSCEDFSGLTWNTNSGSISETCPVVDGFFSGWNTAVTGFEQTIENAPVGIYTAKAITRCPENDESTLDEKCFYAIVETAEGEREILRTGFFGAGNYAPADFNTFIPEIEIKEGSKLTVGVTYIAAGVTDYVCGFGLCMTGKTSSFDYADSIEEMETSSSAIVSSVTYYNVSGMELAAPAKGLNIQKTVYTNGTVTVKKFFKK